MAAPGEYSDQTKAEVLARVFSGHSQIQVAKDLGIPRATVGGWVRRAEAAADAEQAGQLGTSVLEMYGQVLEAALRRIHDLIPKSKIREAVGVVSVIAEKQALATGNPTSIHGEQIVIPEGGSIDDVIAELDRRHAETPPPSEEVAGEDAARGAGRELEPKNAAAQDRGVADGDASDEPGRMEPGT